MLKLYIILAIFAIAMYMYHKQKMDYFEAFHEALEHEKMPDHIDLLTYSTFSPKCCPSVYTSSTGCLCNNNKEFEAIYSRGCNHSV